MIYKRCWTRWPGKQQRLENISDIQKFNQVITFDADKHVRYFSDYWHGYPPMARVNPEYCEAARALKRELVEEFARPRNAHLTVVDLSLRLQDLWKGILSEDFVFSFRNSLEVVAYNGIEREYYRLEWKLRKSIHDMATTIRRFSDHDV